MRPRISAYVSDRDPSSRNITRLPLHQRTGTVTGLAFPPGAPREASGNERQGPDMCNAHVRTVAAEVLDGKSMLAEQGRRAMRPLILGACAAILGVPPRCSSSDTGVRQ